MASTSNISWTHSTLNHWIGCTMFSEECNQCYAAELDAKRFSKTMEGTKAEPVSHWGKGAPRHQTNASRDGTLLAWNKRPWVWTCDGCGASKFLARPLTGPWLCECRASTTSTERRRVFIGSLMDWADEEVPDAWRDRLFDEAEKATDLTLLFLTKRAKKMWLYISARYPNGAPPHFWFGLSWMQKRQDDAAYLINTPCTGKSWLSVEPMLGPVMLHGEKDGRVYNWLGSGGVEWVIFGGESGKNARPCHLDHIRNGVRQCREGGASAFVKQIGRNPVWSDRDMAEKWYERFSDSKGGNMEEWPHDLRVREFPISQKQNT